MPTFHHGPPALAATSPGEARRFGLLVGAAFVVLALVSWRRGRSAAVVDALAAVGALLVLGGLVAPRLLVPAYRGWMALAALLSRVTTPIFMAGVYFLVLTPIGLARRLVGRNPLVARDGDEGYWTPAAPPTSMERQF